MSARHTECDHPEPERPSADAVERDHKLALQDVAFPERVKCGALGEFAWTGQIRKRSDPTRLPPRRRPVPTCATRDDVSSPISPWHPPL